MPCGMGVLARFYRPGEWGFELLFCTGVGGGEFAHQKICRGGGWGWSGLELTDTLS